MSMQRSLGGILVIATLAALLPLPTAAASACTATATTPCAFSCLAGAPITVSASGTGVVAGWCSTAAAECAVQSGSCSLTGTALAASSGTGRCVFVGEGTGACSAPTYPHGEGLCDSNGQVSLGILVLDTPAGTFYVDDRNYALAHGLWVYQETNYVDGLQRGGASDVIPDDSEICYDGVWPPDRLIF